MEHTVSAPSDSEFDPRAVLCCYHYLSTFVVSFSSQCQRVEKMFNDGGEIIKEIISEREDALFRITVANLCEMGIDA